MSKVIELFTANTPNGKKISIMLEEIGYEYKVNTINLNEGEQFKSDFKKISPFSKIPVIKDHENNEIIFESGAILIYLAEKSGKYFDNENRTKLLNDLRDNLNKILCNLKNVNISDEEITASFVLTKTGLIKSISNIRLSRVTGRLDYTNKYRQKGFSGDCSKIETKKKKF